MQDHSIHDLYFAEVIEYLTACVQLPHCRQQVEVSPDSSSLRAVQQWLCVRMQATCTWCQPPHYEVMQYIPAGRLSAMRCKLV